MMEAYQRLIYLCCAVLTCLAGETQVDVERQPQRLEQRPSWDVTDDFLLLHATVRKIRSTDPLKTVNFSNMNITDTRLSEFLIKIEHSNSTSVAVGQISLNLSQNKLTHLQSDYFASIKNLHELDVSQNRIESIKWQLSEQLVILNVSHNQLVTFPSSSCSSFASLQILDISHNKFNSTRNMFANSSNNNNIKSLDLSWNQLTAIDDHSFANLGKLLQLDVSFNAITELQRNTFIGLDALERLHLATNNITHIHNDTFLHMPCLQYLDVSYNNIQIGSIRALQGIPDLIGLSIAYNEELSASLQGFVTTWSLKQLDGSGIGLCEIPAALTQSVKSLNLADNHLQIIRCGDLDSYPLLHKLILSSNELRSIEDDALGRLEMISILYLDNNQLDHIPISLPSSLIELHLEHNEIVELHANAFAQLQSLEQLALSGNPIIYLPGLPLPHLQRLAVRGCRLENVNQAVVKLSPRLKDIYLEDNPIKCADLLGIAEWATPCREYDSSVAAVYEDVKRKQKRKRGKQICPVQELGQNISTVNDKHVNKKKGKKQIMAKKKETKKLQSKSNSLTSAHTFEEHFDDIQHPFDHHTPPPPPPSINSNINNSNNNCSSVNTSAYAEQWVDSSSQVTGHPGLFMVIGVTIGMITAFGLVHLYRRPTLCNIIQLHRRQRRRRHRYEMNNYVAASPLNYHTHQHQHRDDLLHMDHLTTTNTSPIELW